VWSSWLMCTGTGWVLQVESTTKTRPCRNFHEFSTGVKISYTFLLTLWNRPRNVMVISSAEPTGFDPRPPETVSPRPALLITGGETHDAHNRLHRVMARDAVLDVDVPDCRRDHRGLVGRWTRGTR